VLSARFAAAEALSTTACSNKTLMAYSCLRAISRPTPKSNREV